MKNSNRTIPKKVVIAGSVSLPDKIEYWRHYWSDQGYEVIDYPLPIGAENFMQEYPAVHTRFFRCITEADLLFVMNEDKKGIKGYLGAESFAEMCFGIAQNLLHDQGLEVILLQAPEPRVQSFEEISLWLKLGWIKLF